MKITYMNENFAVCALKEEEDQIKIVGLANSEEFPDKDQIENVIRAYKADSAIVVKKYEVAELPFE